MSHAELRPIARNAIRVLTALLLPCVASYADGNAAPTPSPALTVISPQDASSVQRAIDAAQAEGAQRLLTASQRVEELEVRGEGVRVGADPLRAAAECRARQGLPNALAKLTGGKPVRVAFVGGSITEASGWRILFRQWLAGRYPQATIMQIDAAISGTGSDFGAARLEREVLLKRPDLIFVEFAVNDSGRSQRSVMQAMEGIVRKAWAHDPTVDICFVYSLSQAHLPLIQQGLLPSSAAAMEQVADHYGIPSIHMGIEVAQLAADGKLLFTGPAGTATPLLPVFSSDGIHPDVKTGHPFYVSALARSLPLLGGEPAPHAIPKPLDSGHWGNARLIPVADLERHGNWQRLAADHPAVPQVTKASGQFWVAGKPGDSIRFHFRGTAFGLYAIKGPDVGQLTVQVDDGEPVVATLFDPYCTENRYRIRPWFYPAPLSGGAHQVTITIDSKLPDKRAILKRKDLDLSGASPFAQSRLYVSDIIIVEPNSLETHTTLHRGSN